MPENKPLKEIELPKGKIIIDYDKKTITFKGASAVEKTFKSLPEAIALLLPSNLKSAFFNHIEAEYNKYQLDSNSDLVPFSTYCKMYNLTRKAVYLRRDRGEIEISKIGRYSYVKVIK